MYQSLIKTKEDSFLKSTGDKSNPKFINHMDPQ